MYHFSREHSEIIDISRPILVSLEAMGGIIKTDRKISDGQMNITLIQFDTLSRNNAEYPADDLIRSIEGSRYVQENYAQRTWFGEDEHPAQNAPMDRFMFVEPARRAWLIKKYWVAGDKLEGTVAFVPPMGTALQEIIEKHDSNYAASLRAYTPNFVKKTGPRGEYVIKKFPMYPVTFDAVACPGLENARRYNPAEYKAAHANEAYHTDIIFNNPAEELKKMLNSSESAKMLQDMFHFDISKQMPVICGDNRVQFMSTEGQKIRVPLNTYLVGQALNSISKK